MTHDEIQDLLEAYVDETLDRSTRAEVDRHLETCEECRAILEGVPAVELGRMQPSGFDEKAMRRAVRTSLLRLAFNIVAVGLIGWLTLMLLGFLVFQPFVVNRGGRAAAATQATLDLAVMFNPGASLNGAQYNSGIIRRTSEATVVVPVGTDLVELGTLQTTIGPLGFRGVGGAPISPHLGQGPQGSGAEQLAAVGSGTVALVEVQFETPITVARAQELADSSLDVRVVWAGFVVGAGEQSGVGFEPGGTIGYGTCDVRAIDAGLLGASSASIGRSAFTEPPSIARALDATRASIENLLAHRDFIQQLLPFATEESLTAANAYLASQPEVRTLMVTGPTAEVLRFVDEAGAAAVGVHGIEFTNWFQPLCGR